MTPVIYSARDAGRLAYLVKAFPRISETFILNEILELERQGFDLRIYSMIDPPERLRHPAFEQVRSPITYLPNPLLPSMSAVLSDHARQFRRAPRAYFSALAQAVATRDTEMIERFTQAGCLARRLQDDGLSRHDAVHAIACVLSDEMMDRLQPDYKPPRDPNLNYFKRVSLLTVQQWLSLADRGDEER